MPLSALLDGEITVAPDLSETRWVSLRREVKEGMHTLLLRCCQSPALQRTSSLGLQHFYHPPGASCRARGETIGHIRAKLAIYRGCVQAGWRADVEWQEVDWRADVLAAKGTSRYAFEVQWSSQTLQDTLSRQERYDDHGARGCWFFRIAPKGLDLGSDGQCITARHDLPLFLLEERNQGDLKVFLNGHRHLLQDFVVALLGGCVKYRERVTIPETQQVTLEFFEMPCSHCRKASHVYELKRREYTAHCGLTVPLVTHWMGAIRAGYRKEIEREARRFLATDRGRNLRLAPLQIPDATGQLGPKSFRCVWCLQPFDSEEVMFARPDIGGRGRMGPVLETQVRMSGPFNQERPHWCFPDNGIYCAV